MYTVLKNDIEQLPELLAGAWQMSIEYLEHLPTHRATLPEPVVNWPSLPEEGMGAHATQNLFEEIFLPHIVASSGPRYWGFVTGGSTPAALAADWLVSVFDQNSQSIGGPGDCSALLELQTVRMVLDLLRLPHDFNGGFVTGATMSNFSGLAVARQWYGKQLGIDIARDGLRGDIKIYTAMAHSSSLKALAMLGIGSNNTFAIPCLPGREAMDVDALQQVLNENGDEPFILLASAGTVNSVDFDDLEKLAVLKRKYNCWLHVDAAFGAFAACTTDHAQLVNGWKYADSITVDFHKWLNVPYDSAIILTRKEHAMLQTQTFHNSSAPYLGMLSENFSFLNFVPENSRRFRALTVWFTLMAYGKEGYRWLVENDIRLANMLAEKLEASGYFELVAPVRLNTVCFTIHPNHEGELNIASFLRELHKKGTVFMTPSTYLGKACIRAAFVNYRTSEHDVDQVLNDMTEVAGSLLGSKTKNT